MTERQFETTRLVARKHVRFSTKLAVITPVLSIYVRLERSPYFGPAHPGVMRLAPDAASALHRRRTRDAIAAQRIDRRTTARRLGHPVRWLRSDGRRAQTLVRPPEDLDGSPRCSSRRTVFRNARSMLPSSHSPVETGRALPGERLRSWTPPSRKRHGSRRSVQ